MTVTIRMYGFSIPHGFSSKLVPTLAVRCEWKTAQGEELRSVQKSVLPLGNPADSVELEQLNDPAVIKQLWQIAAEAVAKKIVNEVSQDL